MREPEAKEQYLLGNFSQLRRNAELKSEPVTRVPTGMKRTKQRDAGLRDFRSETRSHTQS